MVCCMIRPGSLSACDSVLLDTKVPPASSRPRDIRIYALIAALVISSFCKTRHSMLVIRTAATACTNYFVQAQIIQPFPSVHLSKIPQKQGMLANVYPRITKFLLYLVRKLLEARTSKVALFGPVRSIPSSGSHRPH